MAWSGSKVFMSTIKDVWQNTAPFDLFSDTLKVALFNNSITPSQTAASASIAFDAGVWDNVNEVADSTNWPAGGVALQNKVVGNASNVWSLDSDDPASPGAATLASVFGCLLYDDTLTTPVADQGVSYHYFGGSNSISGGTFTVLVHPSGWVQLTA